jgi:choline dehydrogenase
MPETTYDYIIIGAGSAGCVLANRLSAQPDRTVLLLEAGASDRSSAIQTPAAFPTLFKGKLDWNYTTEPQVGLDGRSLYWPRGKVLGGCSAMNAMIYIRGNPQDYDNWAKQGNIGWSYADVLPYFQKAEHQVRSISENYGTGGPLDITNLRDPNPLSIAFIAAAQEIGLPFNADFNGTSQEGIGWYRVNQRNGKRCSTAIAYLKPILKRSNLKILTRATVLRIHLEHNRVVRVVYWHKGTVHQVRAAQEIILCGGAINSPQLLMLSGIGPADRLRALGIQPIVHLPGVGQNLQDHLVASPVYQSTQPVSLINAETPGSLLKYLLFKKGSLTSNLAEAGGFVRVLPPTTLPDLQFHFAPAPFYNHGFARIEGHGFALGITPLQPKSRGWLSLRSKDPTAPPCIQPNYLTQETDWPALIEGFKLARQIIAAKAFNPYRGEEVIPSLNVQSDREIRDFMRATVETLYHPVGTCKMGNDEMAVVSPQLQVYGIEGLRVVDASIMPTIPHGNTNAPTIMIAEKAADMIQGKV